MRDYADRRMVGGVTDRLPSIQRQIADAFGIPVEILRLTDQEFHEWLHNTDAGRALLAADGER